MHINTCKIICTPRIYIQGTPIQFLRQDGATDRKMSHSSKREYRSHKPETPLRAGRALSPTPEKPAGVGPQTLERLVAY